MRKVTLSLLTVSTFAVGYAAGACLCALLSRRRPVGLDAGSTRRGELDRGHRRSAHGAEMPAHHELANWARQAMFAHR